MVAVDAGEAVGPDGIRLIKAIHASPTRVVIEFAGAGAQALAWLHAVAGSSRTVVEAVDRYHPASMIEALGYEPAHFVSAEVARRLAVNAFARACALCSSAERVAGLAWTATIATDRSKRGDHRCHVATCDAQGTRAYELELIKGARTREQEERVVSELVLAALAEVSGVESVTPLALDATEQVERSIHPASLIARLQAGDFEWVAAWPDGTRTAGRRRAGVALVSGSFNPLHEGHLGMAAAARHLGREVFFELPLVNADKSAIAVGEAERRLAQFHGVAPLLLTRLPRFVDKARCFPGSVFVIGVDTLTRLLEPRFYGDAHGAVDAALREVERAGCRFLVAGRLDRERQAFLTADDLPLPRGFRHLIQSIEEKDFREDVSSMELRAGELRARLADS